MTDIFRGNGPFIALATVFAVCTIFAVAAPQEEAEATEREQVMSVSIHLTQMIAMCDGTAGNGYDAARAVCQESNGLYARVQCERALLAMLDLDPRCQYKPPKVWRGACDCWTYTVLCPRSK